LYWDVEVTPEEEDEIIKKIAERMHKYGMNVPAILLLETVKPLSYIGSQMGYFFISPFLPIFGEEIGLTGTKLLKLLENRDNLDKIIQYIEELSKKDEELKQSQKEIESSERPKKKGWRKFLPFIIMCARAAFN
jgi:DNA-binding transcriptional regulator GbsR (MarR family)